MPSWPWRGRSDAPVAPLQRHPANASNAVADPIAARVALLLRDCRRVGETPLTPEAHVQLSQLWRELVQHGPAPVSSNAVQRQRVLSTHLWHDRQNQLLDQALDLLAPPQEPAPLDKRGIHLIVVLGVPVDLSGRIGPGLLARINRGAYEAKQDPNAILLVSGAAVSSIARANQWVEAYAMKLGLVAAGVDPQRIIVEPNAVSTMNNASFGWQLLYDTGVFSLGQGGSIDKVTLVAEPYHALRAMRIFISVLQQEASPPRLHFSPAERIAQVTRGRRTERRIPSTADLGSLADIDRCLDEKYKITRGW